MRLVSLPIVLATVLLGATLAVAEPSLVVRYPNGIPQITLAGDFTGTYYTVSRAPARGGVFDAITADRVLCTGACSTEDRTAQPGESYFYRFDFVVATEAGTEIVTYGPYLATISPVLARAIVAFVYPNPGNGSTTVELHIGGTAAVPGDAAIYDLAGRQVRVLQRGVMPSGLTTVQWDGRDETGERLRSGIYLLRFSARGQQTTMRIVRR